MRGVKCVLLRDGCTANNVYGEAKIGNVELLEASKPSANAARRQRGGTSPAKNRVHTTKIPVLQHNLLHPSAFSSR